MENGFCDGKSSSCCPVGAQVRPLGNFVPALQLISSAQPADLVEIDRKIYSQWAIYIGDGRIVYVAGERADFPTNNGEAKVRRTTLTAAAKGCLVRVNNKTVPARERKLNCLDPAVVVENARRQIGRTVDFNLFEKNSEHYATQWKFGQGWSDQADTAHKVMTIFKSQQVVPKRLPCNRHSAPGSLHAMMTGLSAIFQPGGGNTNSTKILQQHPHLNTTTSLGNINNNRSSHHRLTATRRQNSQ